MRRRKPRHYRPVFSRCEQRVLPAAIVSNALAELAAPLDLDATQQGIMAQGDVDFFQIDPPAAGKLNVVLHTGGTSIRLTLLNSQYEPLMQSEGLSSQDPEDRVTLYVQAGMDFIRLQNLGGAGSFELSTTFSTGYSALQPISLPSVTGFPQIAAIAVGEFNGDGSSDLAIADASDEDVEILMGNGDGSFRTAVTYLLNYLPTAIVAGDFGNGHVDLAVTVDSFDAGFVSDSVSILLGDGKGNFQAGNTYSVGNGADAIAVGHFRNKDETDLAVANSYSNNVSVLLGTGEGNFQQAVEYNVGAGPDAIAVGDFTGDGVDDLAVGNLFNGGIYNDVTVLLGIGDGTFQNFGSFSAGPGLPIALVVGDFNNDGHADLAALDEDQSGLSNVYYVAILIDNGQGIFQETAQYNVGPLASAIVAGDFSGDGRTDLAVAVGSYVNLATSVSLFHGNGDGTFENPIEIPIQLPQNGPLASTGEDYLATGDFNDDGRSDLVLVSAYGNVTVLLGNGDGEFQSPGLAAIGVAPIAMATGDFNGDGHTDLVVVDEQTNTISILLGNGDGSFQNPVNYAVGSGPDAIAVGDFNGDGRLDLAVANSGDSTVSILLGNGDGTFQDQVAYAVGTHPVAIATGDFNEDGHLDLAVVGNPGTDQLGSVSILLGRGDGGFDPAATYDAGLEPNAIVACELTHDGYTDLAITNAIRSYYYTVVDGIPHRHTSSGGVSIFLGMGNGTFQPAAVYPVDGEANALAAGDFNGDGLTDLAVSTDYDVSLLMGNGVGGFENEVKLPAGTAPAALLAGDLENQVEIPVGIGPDAIVAGDFGGNGLTDLAVVNTGDNTVSILQNEGSGDFTSLAPFPVYSLQDTTALVAADFNNDGRLDLALINSATNGVSVLLGLGNGIFTSETKFALTPPVSPVLADLRGTGVKDVFTLDESGNILWREATAQIGIYAPPVIINSGLPSRAIAAVETNQGPVLASIDASYDGVELYAWRGNQFQQIGALATEALPEAIVEGSLGGDGVESLVVLNAGDGTLSIFQASPPTIGSGQTFMFSLAQTLTVGFEVSDLNLLDLNDTGRLDIVVTNKLAGEVGVLDNQGDGTFSTPIWYAASKGDYEETTTDNESTGVFVLPRPLPASLAATLVTPPETSPPPFHSHAIERPSYLPNFLASGQATIGVISVAPTPGALPALVALNPGSNTIGLLARLSNGLIASPTSILTPAPAIAAQVADLNGDGISDMAILSSQGVSVAFGNGQGGFSPFITYPAGSDPTGLTIADLNGHPDLLVSDTEGDILVLLGDGKGDFQQPQEIDESVALAAAEVPGAGGPAFFLAAQPNDSVSVQFAHGSATLLNRSDGLLDPGAVQVADLNGSGVPYLIVANSGGNDVLVYPILSGDQLGPALNNGFATGTDPVGITVANLNGRPDLIVADKGSNDVTVLLNQALPSGGFTFVEGPRLKVGLGPVATVVQDVDGDGIPDLLVSDSGSNTISVLPGVGGGFFNDTNATTIPVGVNPGPIFVIPNLAVPSQIEVATVNAGSNNVTVLLDVGGGDFVTAETLPSGGESPLTAVEGTFDGEDGLLVGNNVDGALSLFLAGANGLELAQTFHDPNLPNPSGLALDSSGAIYATTDGVAAAFPIILGLGTSPVTGELAPVSSVIVSASPAEQQLILLQPLSQTSLSMVATLLSVALETSTGEDAELTPILPPNQPALRSVGITTADTEPAVVASPTPFQGLSVPVGVTRFVIGLGDAFARRGWKLGEGRCWRSWPRSNPEVGEFSRGCSVRIHRSSTFWLIPEGRGSSILAAHPATPSARPAIPWRPPSPHPARTT